MNRASLPLLSFALAETWSNRDGRMLTVDGYLATGGLRQAIATSAERLYEGLPAEPTGSGQRAPAAIGDALPPTARPSGSAIGTGSVITDDDHRQVVDVFVRTRLVVASDNGLEVAHEALVREWPRLRTLARRGPSKGFACSATSVRLRSSGTGLGEGCR